jgi:hypothetical protein
MWMKYSVIGGALVRRFGARDERVCVWLQISVGWRLSD